MVAKHERVVIRVNGDNRLSLVYNHLTLENARSLLDQQGIELTAFHRLRPGLDAAMFQWLRTEQSNPSVGR
jgi:hypothetical protein